MPDRNRRGIDFAARPELQRRARSVTACCLDLGDFPAPTSASDDNLLHVLSDQQWGLHWLPYIDRAGNEAMVVSSDPIGFVLDEDWEEPPPAVVPVDGTYDLDVCADSFAELGQRHTSGTVHRSSPHPLSANTFAALDASDGEQASPAIVDLRTINLQFNHHDEVGAGITPILALTPDRQICI